MNEIIDFLTSNTTLAYVTAIFIFIVTIILLIRRLIGFMVTLLLLAFAIISGLAIANHDLFREVLSSFKYDPEKNREDKFTHFKDKLSHAYEELKEELTEQKRKIEAMYEAYTSPTKEPQEEKKP